jgi:hypothetical protein
MEKIPLSLLLLFPLLDHHGKASPLRSSLPPPFTGTTASTTAGSEVLIQKFADFFLNLVENFVNN